MQGAPKFCRRTVFYRVTGNYTIHRVAGADRTQITGDPPDSGFHFTFFDYRKNCVGLLTMRGPYTDDAEWENQLYNVMRILFPAGDVLFSSYLTKDFICDGEKKVCVTYDKDMNVRHTITADEARKLVRWSRRVSMPPRGKLAEKMVIY